MPLNNNEIHSYSIACMVCAIVGLVLSCVPGMGVILGTIALVLHSKVSKVITAAEDKKMATAGLICGIIAVSLGVIFSAIIIVDELGILKETI